ncbi:TPA: hypothetical protein L7434_002165 [Klebsiella pneumoniae]|jgi:hypothetical protein|uniref:hypothetical protein n=1 Tax=Enterobacterales TaxID=91347 RepID=UPI00177E8819|nr:MULTISPECIES: hypothetical protein [Enterobacterales]MBD8153318.1 hypothetical protein [Pantoea agglomerans]MDW1327279.1 hypothetical protein [Klebsiella pneumoniae]UWB30134.1 hypothetical protein M5R31_02335 [Klebsiella pneumoniae]GKM82393.1 hypothetical protein NUBL17183_05740 [Klebsiella pneumoniae]HBQ5105211.1 hypothetical protein [Klebsiella pneumoniae]
MNEKEAASLYRSLMNSRESFMHGRTRASRSQPRQRMTERDRELRECMRNR